jgi:hypothetical protein
MAGRYSTGRPPIARAQNLMTAASAKATASDALAIVDVYARRTPGCVFPDKSLTSFPLLKSRMKIAAPVPLKFKARVSSVFYWPNIDLQVPLHTAQA